MKRVDIVFNNKTFDFGFIWNIASIRDLVVQSDFTAAAGVLSSKTASTTKMANTAIQALNIAIERFGEAK